MWCKGERGGRGEKGGEKREGERGRIAFMAVHMRGEVSTACWDAQELSQKGVGLQRDVEVSCE